MENINISYCFLVTYIRFLLPPELYIPLIFLACLYRYSGPESYRRGQNERKTDFIEPEKRGKHHGNGNSCTFSNKSQRCFL